MTEIHSGFDNEMKYKVHLRIDRAIVTGTWDTIKNGGQEAIPGL
jgi:hypothetical protein